MVALVVNRMQRSLCSLGATWNHRVPTNQLIQECGLDRTSNPSSAMWMLDARCVKAFRVTPHLREPSTHTHACTPTTVQLFETFPSVHSAAYIRRPSRDHFLHTPNHSLYFSRLNTPSLLLTSLAYYDCPIARTASRTTSRLPQHVRIDGPRGHVSSRHDPPGGARYQVQPRQPLHPAAR